MLYRSNIELRSLSWVTRRSRSAQQPGRGGMGEVTLGTGERVVDRSPDQRMHEGNRVSAASISIRTSLRASRDAVTTSTPAIAAATDNDAPSPSTAIAPANADAAVSIRPTRRMIRSPSPVGFQNRARGL
jgi:hypothetical protein